MTDKAIEAAAEVLYSYGNFGHDDMTEIEARMFEAEVVIPVIEAYLDASPPLYRHDIEAEMELRKRWSDLSIGQFIEGKALLRVNGADNE